MIDLTADEIFRRDELHDIAEAEHECCVADLRAAHAFLLAGDMDKVDKIKADFESMGFVVRISEHACGYRHLECPIEGGIYFT